MVQLLLLLYERMDYFLYYNGDATVSPVVVSWHRQREQRLLHGSVPMFVSYQNSNHPDNQTNAI